MYAQTWSTNSVLLNIIDLKILLYLHHSLNASVPIQLFQLYVWSQIQTYVVYV